MHENLAPRIGSFFILLGLVLFFVFLGSILGKDAKISYLLISGGLLFLGSIFRRRVTPSEPTRFSTIRKINQRTRQRREDKQEKKEK